MINIKKDGYGSKIRANFGQDISAATAFTMSLMPYKGSELTPTPTLGTSRVAVGDEYYQANEYVEYAITDGMFDDYALMIWEKRATALVGTEMIPTKYEKFRVIE